MSFKGKRNGKRSLSAHQKQMRFMAVLFILLVLVIFALAFYAINRWVSPVTL